MEMSEKTDPDVRIENGATRPEPDAAQPVAPGTAGSRGQGSGGKMLIGLGIAVLSVVVIAASFGLGYAIGHRDEGVPQLGRALRQNALDGIAGGAGKQGAQDAGVRGRLRQMVASGEASVVRGSVASVEDGAVTVDTPDGQQTVSLTDRTRYLVAGGGASGGGPGAMEPGQQVQVLARKAGDGSLSAVAVRMGTDRMKPEKQDKEQ